MHQVRVAVVTGGGSGIGRASALALAADGWTVLLVGRRVAALEAVVADGAQLTGRLLARPADVTDESAVAEVFDGAVAQFGRVDLLFNNAGMFAPARDIDEIPLAEWTAVVAVNLTGAFLCAREAFRVMKTQEPRGGRIINNGSISAQTPRVKAVAYTATKHAITGLTKSLSLDGRPYDIACGQIDVGNAATELTARWDDGTPQPNGTLMVEPKMDVRDVGRTVAFMASLPLDANVQTVTVMATAMPFIGRG
jgi:NAD(P)-dependent dehydrogenase (short-subunit alcohol dehydrogenase family)